MIRVTDMIMTIAGSAAAMSLDALPAPVVVGESIEIEWSRPTVLESAEPTTLTFEMIRPAWSKLPPPAQDSPITLTGVIPEWLGDDSKRETLFRGWIDSITQHPRERGGDLTGLTRFTITATCAIGVLARTKIGDAPWPREEPRQRMARIYDLAPQCFTSDPATWEHPMPGGLLVERDVDSTPAMQVLEATASPDSVWFTLDADTGLVALFEQPWYSNTGYHYGHQVYDHDTYGWLTNSTAWPITTAHAAPDVDRAQTWGTGLATVTVSHYLTGTAVSAAYAANTQRSRTYGRTTAPGQAITLASDRIEGSGATDEAELSDVPFNPHPAMVDLAQALLAAGSQEESTIDTVTIPLAAVELSTSRALRDMLHVGPGRFQTIYLPGVEFGVPLAYSVMGGRLSLSVLGEQTVELTLAPVSQLGIIPLTYADVAPYDMQFEQWDSGASIYELATTTAVIG